MTENHPVTTDPFPTLAELFLTRAGRLPAIARRRLESAARTREVREAMHAAAPQLSWRTASRLIARRMPELFEVSVLELLLAGCGYSDLLAEYAAKSRRDPGKVYRVPLPEKRLNTVHHPRIDLLIDDTVVDELELTIHLDLALSATEVVVANGELRALVVTGCSGSGEVAVGDTIVLKKDFGKVVLPKEVRFEPGVPIPTAQLPYVWGEGPARIDGRSTSSAGRGQSRALAFWVGAATLAVGLWIGTRLNDAPDRPSYAGYSVSESADEPLPDPRSLDESVGAQAPSTELQTTPTAMPVPALPRPELADGTKGGNDDPNRGTTYGLTVKPSPAEARVRIMNIVEPYRPGIRLPPGPYQIRVDHPEYVSEDRWIELSDRDRVLEIVLESRPPVRPIVEQRRGGALPRLFLRTEPPGAKVMLLRDGRWIPFRSGSPLSPGRHSLTITANGYQPAIEIVELTRGDEEINVRLRPDLIH